MITPETQFLSRLCSLCYLLFKSSSVPSVATGVNSAALGRHARRRTCRMLTLETQFLIRLCSLCYLLFKSSSFLLY